MADRPLLRQPRRLLGRLAGGVSVFAAEVMVVLVIGVLAFAVAGLVEWIF